MTFVAVHARNLAFLQAIGAGARPIEALRAAGIEAASPLEAAGHLSWYVDHGLVERVGDLRDTAAPRVIAALFEGCAVAAQALAGAVQHARASVIEQRDRQWRAAAAERAAPLDLEWERAPCWQPHPAPQVIVKPCAHGEPPQPAAPLAVSATAYPLT